MKKIIVYSLSDSKEKKEIYDYLEGYDFIVGKGPKSKSRKIIDDAEEEESKRIVGKIYQGTSVMKIHVKPKSRLERLMNKLMNEDLKDY